ncbi:nucleotide exchange factor GrpE [Clostridium magnum]|uniref:Protein GrpE n=1 Tax=Clostridium magnum DSM 2767 TaxID=1121326 RepID=A0A161Y6E2_9CLOT|nr:nucleotide exchange factor GrpE [Clostridium magnum]KZL93879.1 protein GrpE [Clostridium magnum DSM 2767]SHH97742.1 molecular chaperone GrpE [Clostridium magnum DSM 2767]
MFNRKDKKVEDQNEIRDNEPKEELENNSEEVLEECEVDTDKVAADDSDKLSQALVDELTKSNKNLVEENKKMSNENDTLKDRLARTVAEYDNFRKRTAKEKEGIYTDACEDVLKEMLPVLDNLERAISVDGTVDDLKKGVEMTIKQFKNALEKLNVEEISTEGEFNPHVHNAVMHVDDDQYGNNQVVEVFQKGYKRGEKVLRHSMVKVAN